MGFPIVHPVSKRIGDAKRPLLGAFPSTLGRPALSGTDSDGTNNPAKMLRAAGSRKALNSYRSGHTPFFFYGLSGLSVFGFRLNFVYETTPKGIWSN